MAEAFEIGAPIIPKVLVYSSDSEPGITRRRTTVGFTYWNPDGTRITDREEIQRISSLAIPPAYEDVWICPDERGHLQATGRDAKGRKQYRYHSEWTAMQSNSKFDHMIEFGRALPVIRERLAHDAAKRGLTKERILAVMIMLLEKTLIRIGNDEYVRSNRSYGLTTLLTKQVDLHGSLAEFKFKGKSGKVWSVTLRDRRLAKVLQSLQELPGQELFSFPDSEGNSVRLTSTDVNAYLAEISPVPTTAKDFRTWAGSREALLELSKCESVETKLDRKKAIKSAIQRASDALGNTPTVCRKSYIHPSILESAERNLPIEIGTHEDDDEALLKFLSTLRINLEFSREPLRFSAVLSIIELSGAEF